MKCTITTEENKIQRGQRISLEELAESIELLKYETGMEIFKITESSIKRGKVTYLIRYLQIELEDGIVIGSDLDNILLENMHALSGLVKKSVQKVYKIYANNECDELDYFKIYLSQGFIEIRPILS